MRKKNIKTKCLPFIFNKNKVFFPKMQIFIWQERKKKKLHLKKYIQG